MESIWTKDICMPEFPRLEKDAQTDVLIIGGGLAGLLCAHSLQQAGVRYLLIEADRICRGVTAGTTAKITSQHGLVYHKLLRRFGAEIARVYYDANEAALRQYRELARTVDCDLVTEDNYIYAREAAPLEREMASLWQLRIPGELIKGAALPLGATGAVRFRDQARFHPLKFAAGIAKDLNIYEQTRAVSFAPGMVKTERGTIRARKIIVATHFPILNKHGGYFLKMYQQRSYVLALSGADKVDGMYLDGGKNGLSLRPAGDFLLLGGGGHRTGKQGGGWAELESAAKQHFPGAKEVCRWATQDCMTLDGIPYIGQYSAATPELFVATGFNKWGMTSAMVSAMILTDLVQGRENPFAKAFTPQRTALRPQLAVNAVEATVNLLTPTVPRCPHLGCALKWNRQERTWDCPCHGSRFAEDGQLLDNPATGDLKKKS